MMRSVLFHPLGLTFLVLSALTALILPRVPVLQHVALPAGWLLFWGVAAYVATTIALLWPARAQSQSPGDMLAGATGYAGPYISPNSISGLLRSESITRPYTLLFLASALLTVAYLLLLGGGIWVWLLLVLSLCGAGASFIWDYVFRYSERYMARMEEMMSSFQREQARIEAANVEKLRNRLREGFARVNSNLAARALRGLEDAYAQLQPLLQRRRETDPLSLIQVPALAGETFRRGLSVLDDALELMRAAYGTNSERLKDEISGLECEIQASRNDESQRLRNERREERLVMQRQQLQGLEQLEIDIDQLLFQAERCEASLYRTRLDLAAIRAGTTETSLDSVIETLRRTVEQARATQDELRRLVH